MLSGYHIADLKDNLLLSGGAIPFQSLKALLVGQNRLAAWQCIDACDQFPSLSSLRLTGNPHPADEPGKRFEVPL